ncbi:MAG: alpha/beta hydrolase [Candidatus Tectimicrobiota bacterium]
MSREEDGRIPVGAGVTLAAKWTLPHGQPRGVVLLLQGSGQVDCDGDVSGPLLGSGYQGAAAPLSKQLAEALGAIGVASLRYTKRGYAADPFQGVFAPLDLLQHDAAAALACVRGRFPGLKHGLVGFSEGALLAALLAAESPVDLLCLLAVPTTSIDAACAYQYVHWPIELLRHRVDTNHDAMLTAAELALLGERQELPLLGPALTGLPWRDLVPAQQEYLSVTHDLLPAYQRLYTAMLEMLASPPLAAWYHSARALPSFAAIASRIRTPVLLYQGLDDAQIDWKGIVTEQYAFAAPATLRLFPGLGHCFAPMVGAIGEHKTSGPLAASLLTALCNDVQAAW